MSFSFEVFPPKTDQPLEPLLETLDELCAFKPDFISCTYGAGGTNKGRNKEVCAAIADRAMTPMTHFTCIGNSKEDVERYIGEYVEMGMENVLALRGDFPEGWSETHGDFHHADQLIGFIKEKYPELCIGAACYPEKHIQASSLEKDIAHLRSKQDNGAEFLMSQICHDVDAYQLFHDKLRKAGVKIPIIVGVMPVLFKDGLIRMTLSNGCSIPKELAEIIGKYGDNPADFKKAGKEYTVNQIYKFINLGIDGIHIYSLNKYKDLADVIRAAGLR
ncbi:MAG: methylenetetrahydrofolate reductase [Clostridia bacterium]|nr:methylenetetrahydrofolate reductase [Clostridia bacterium]